MRQFSESASTPPVGAGSGRMHAVSCGSEGTSHSLVAVGRRVLSWRALTVQVSVRKARRPDQVCVGSDSTASTGSDYCRGRGAEIAPPPEQQQEWQKQHQEEFQKMIDQQHEEYQKSYETVVSQLEHEKQQAESLRKQLAGEKGEAEPACSDGDEEKKPGGKQSRMCVLQ